jgi:opacity protein-like surface antigen
MRGRANFAAAAVTAAAMAAASAASAAIVTVTIDGTVAQGFDNFQTFGGGNLAGDAFQAVFKFDTSAPAFSQSNSQVTFINGGSEFPIVSPSLGASITINGDTATIAGSYYGELWASRGGGITEQMDTAYDDSVGVNGEDLSKITIDSFGLLPGTIDQPIAKTTLLGDSSGQVQILTSNAGGVQNAFADLVATSLTETVAGVPEPASWALMLCGFAAVGATLRARRRPAAA